MRNQKHLCPFSHKFCSQFWMEFSMLPQRVGLLKPMLNSFCTSVLFKGENSTDVIYKICV